MPKVEMMQSRKGYRWGARRGEQKVQGRASLTENEKS